MIKALKHAFIVLVSYVVLFILGLAFIGSAMIALDWLGRLAGLWR